MRRNMSHVILAMSFLSIGLFTSSAVAIAQERMKFNYFPPPAESNYGKVLVPYLDNVMSGSDGAVSIKSFPGGSLGKNPRLQLKMLSDGVFDITWAVPAYTPGRFPDNGVMDLPGLFKNSTEASITVWRLHEKNLLRGYDNYKVLGFGGLYPYLIHSRKPIKAMADLKKMKIRAGGPIHGAMIKGLGGTPIGMPAPAIAESVSRGVIDAVSIEWLASKAFRILDVTNYHFEVNLGSNVLMLVMDRKRFDGLSAPAKAAFDKYGREQLSKGLGSHMDDVSVSVRASIKNNAQHTVITPTSSEQAEFEAIGKKVIADWVAATEGGDKLLATARQILSEIRAQ